MTYEAERVVLGAGPLGLAVARVLAEQDRRATLVTRSGTAPAPHTMVVSADVTQVDEARRACRGASVVYHCVGAPYGEWARTLPAVMRGAIEGAASADATLVYGDNLYMYGPGDRPLTEGVDHAATGRNGRVRARLAHELLDAHRAGTVRATIGRSSDFYGPHARHSIVGDGVFRRVLQGRAARVLGDPGTPHTYTFIDDFARALVTLGEREQAWGRAWHVPSADTLTTRGFVELVYRELGRPPRITTAPSMAIRLLGLVDLTMRGVHEVLYQSQRPWVVDHDAFARAFGADPTPHADAIRSTLAWYRANEDPREA